MRMVMDKDFDMSHEDVDFEDVQRRAVKAFGSSEAGSSSFGGGGLLGADVDGMIEATRKKKKKRPTHQSSEAPEESEEEEEEVGGDRDASAEPKANKSGTDKGWLDEAKVNSAAKAV